MWKEMILSEILFNTQTRIRRKRPYPKQNDREKIMRQYIVNRAMTWCYFWQSAKVSHSENDGNSVAVVAVQATYAAFALCAASDSIFFN